MGTTEAEYIALSEVLLKVLSIRKMQEFVVAELESCPSHEWRSRNSNTN